jgi:hypothetical protein
MDCKKTVGENNPLILRLILRASKTAKARIVRTATTLIPKESSLSPKSHFKGTQHTYVTSFCDAMNVNVVIAANLQFRTFVLSQTYQNIPTQFPKTFSQCEQVMRYHPLSV